MKTTSIKPLWAFLAVLAAFPATGIICAIYYHSISMFYVSLIAVPIAAIVFPFIVLTFHSFTIFHVGFIGILMGLGAVVGRIWGQTHIGAMIGFGVGVFCIFTLNARQAIHWVVENRKRRAMRSEEIGK